MTTIYHNPRCSKSRAALALLRARSIEPRIVQYLQTPPDAATLRDLLAMLRCDIRDLIRTTEPVYKELRQRAQHYSAAQLIHMLAAPPQLLQRPIVAHNARAAIGRPPENILTLF